ncbi:hypothetical protein [Lentzea terrae]|uniref:hypothetical protein n=1 Tax=Lentzea terrae TaxID=2200761 RepID=UPI0013006771|nr:hypothetical protein [Lentzea terrae]
MHQHACEGQCAVAKKRHTIAKSPIRNPKLTLFGSAARLGRTYDSSPVLSETDLHES